MALNRYRLKHLIEQKNKNAIKAHKLLQRPDQLICLILLGNNLTNVLASSLATVIAIRFGGEQTIVIVAFLLTLIILIFAEVTPKTLAAIKPEILAFPAAAIYTPLLKIFYPIVWIVNLIVKVLLKIIGINIAKNEHDLLNKDELKSIVAEAGNIMPTRYQHMLLGILDLESVSVEDIMTPRNEIIGIDIEDSIKNIIKQIQKSHHAQLPFYKKNIDSVIGLLHTRTISTLIAQPNLDKQDIIKSLAKPCFIPEITPLHKQIQSFKMEKLSIGLVIDEYGNVQGLITLDDLLQVIVGEFITEEVDVRKQDDGSYLVDGSVTIHKLNRITQWSLPTAGPKTLNGLIVEYMEIIPRPSTSIRLHGYLLEIIKMNKNAVKLVKFYPQ